MFAGPIDVTDCTDRHGRNEASSTEPSRGVPINTNDGRYSDEEFALILERAAELQDRAEGGAAQLPAGGHTATGSEGLSLAEVRDIAGEVGLEARFIDQAAASLALARADTRRGLLGGPITTQMDETFQRPLTDGERMELVDVVRGALNHHGEVSEVMGAVEWKSVGRVDRMTVTITSSDETSSVRIFHDASGLAALTWVGSITSGLILGVAAVGALDPSSLLMTAFILGAGGAMGIGAARTIWSRATKAIRRKSERLRDEIARRLER